MICDLGRRFFANISAAFEIYEWLSFRKYLGRRNRCPIFDFMLHHYYVFISDLKADSYELKNTLSGDYGQKIAHKPNPFKPINWGSMYCGLRDNIHDPVFWLEFPDDFVYLVLQLLRLEHSLFLSLLYLLILGMSYGLKNTFRKLPEKNLTPFCASCKVSSWSMEGQDDCVVMA